MEKNTNENGVERLFSPFKLGNLALTNRVVMAPMTRSASVGNVPNDKVVEYYKKRAEGGVGLIITEGVTIDHAAAGGYPNVPFIHGEEALAGWKKVVDAVHAAEGKIAAQLWHVGGVREAGVDPGGDTPGYSPSGMSMLGVDTGHAMDKADIDQVVAAFAKAAKDAKAVGFDAIELHGAHGYLIDQFFWKTTNIREDEYGKNKSLFAIEIIRAVRKAVGDDFPVIFRFSQWKQQDYSARLTSTPEELKAFLVPLSEAGVDIFHCSTRRFWEPEFEGSDLNLAGWASKLTGKPTITVGSVGLNEDYLPAKGETLFKDAKLTSLDELIKRMDNKEFELVAVGRALIANADWPNQVKGGNFEKLKNFDKAMLMSLD